MGKMKELIKELRVLGVSDEEIREGLKKYTPVGGRANVKDTGRFTVINDCYNANPNSMFASLTSLCSVKGERVAILGDMGELGDDKEKLHFSVGEKAGQLGLDTLIACGTLSKNTYDGYMSACGKNGIYFETKSQLFEKLPELIKDSQTILVTASHAGKFEEIVEKLEQL